MRKLGKKYKLPKVVQAEKLIGAIEWDDLDWIVESGLNIAAKIEGIDAPLTKDQISLCIEQQIDVMPQVLNILSRQLSPDEGEEEEEAEKKIEPGPAFKK